MRRLGLLTTSVVICAVLGCATASHRVHLREPEELPRFAGRAGAFVYAESASAPAMVGRLSSDSLELYRSSDGVWYQREVRRAYSGGVQVAGYTLSDGRHVRFDGSVRRVGDSLAFERRVRARSMEAQQGPDSFVLPLREVRSVDVELPDTGRTVMAVAILTLFATTAFLFAAAASLSEPLL